MAGVIDTIGTITFDGLRTSMICCGDVAPTSTVPKSSDFGAVSRGGRSRTHTSTPPSVLTPIRCSESLESNDTQRPVLEMDGSLAVTGRLSTPYDTVSDCTVS